MFKGPLTQVILTFHLIAFHIPDDHTRILSSINKSTFYPVLINSPACKKATVCVYLSIDNMLFVPRKLLYLTSSNIKFLSAPSLTKFTRTAMFVHNLTYQQHWTTPNWPGVWTMTIWCSQPGHYYAMFTKTSE